MFWPRVLLIKAMIIGKRGKSKRISHDHVLQFKFICFFWQQFQGNYDRYSVRTHAFRPALLARYVRINPRRWHGWMSMRLELYGGRWSKQFNLFYKDL